MGAFAGGPEKICAPRLDADAKLVRGDGGYTLVLDGYLELPDRGEYNVESIVAKLVVDGRSVSSKRFGPAVVSGPSSYPFSFSPEIGYSARKAAVHLEANVSRGKEQYSLSVELPVALPDRNTVIKEPELYLWLSSLNLLGSTKSLTFTLRVHNPNDSELRFDSLVLSAGGSDHSLGLEKLPAGSSATVSQTVSVPSDVRALSLKVAGRYRVEGVSRAFERAFEVNVPQLSGQPLRFHISADALSLSRKGYELNVFGEVENPNPFNITLESLGMRVVGGHGEGNIVQDSTLLADIDIPPGSRKRFSKVVKVNSVLAGAVAQVVATYGGRSVTVVSFPVPLLDPSEFVSPPTVGLSLAREGNTCRIEPSLAGTEYNVDVSLSLEVNAGSNHISKDYGEFLLSGSKPLEPVSVDAGNPVVATVSGKYGVRELGVWFPLRYSVEANCAT